MRSLLLISGTSFDIGKFEKIMEGYGQKRYYMNNGRRFYVENGEEYIALEYYGTTGEGVFYEEGELDHLKLDKPKFFSLEYKSIDWIKPILQIILNRNDIWVDNDRILVSGKEFLERLSREPKWDFNYEP